MGSGKYDATEYRTFAASTVGKTTEEIYVSRSLKKDLDPKGVNRESRDSVDNPKSTPLIVALDVTGSMGVIADNIAREGLGTLFEGILDRKPISDPHIMFMGIGDANYDISPLQVSQFEADTRIIDQLTDLYIEHGGGGNNFESYNLAWYFAAEHTVHDSFENRAKKGYLFTIGDEEAPWNLTAAQIEKICGDKLQKVPTTKEMLEAAQKTYDVFHIIIKQGSHCRLHFDNVKDSWTKLLGQRVIVLEDYKLLTQTIVSAIEVAEGVNAEDSAKRWGKGAVTVEHAVKGITPSGRKPKLLTTGKV